MWDNSVHRCEYGFPSREFVAVREYYVIYAYFTIVLVIMK